MQAELQPIMNDTKWRELIAEMRELQEQGFVVQHRAKDVTGSWPSPRDWDGEWFYHLVPWKGLEWVDIRCEERQDGPRKPSRRLDAAEIAAVERDICARLKKHGIPNSREGGLIRVWGYARPGQSPQWS